MEAAAAVWGMDHFNEYLKGKKFILYTDHKPLEKLGHLHGKTMNRFQTALLEHDFIIQYKKGSDMFDPKTLHFTLIVHIPLLSNANLLELYEFLPLQIHFNFSSNVSITPDVGQNNFLAIGGQWNQDATSGLWIT
jgi:hypothetical protein